MVDEPTRAVIAAAYERLRTKVLSDISEESKLRAIALQSLDELRDRILHDPSWVEETIEILKKGPQEPPEPK